MKNRKIGWLTIFNKSISEMMTTEIHTGTNSPTLLLLFNSFLVNNFLCKVVIFVCCHFQLQTMDKSIKNPNNGMSIN